MKILFALAFIALAGLSVIGMAGALLLASPLGFVISGVTMASLICATRAMRLV